MSGGGKGGKSNQEVTMPKFAETALQQGIGMSRDVAGMGYTPYYGPDVAAFSPMQEAAFQGTDAMASAFNMPTTGGQQYMPQAQNMGGAMGYSSGNVFDASKQALAQRAPAQYDYINSFSVDPVTGQMGSRAPSNQPVALEMQNVKRGK